MSLTAQPRFAIALLGAIVIPPATSAAASKRVIVDGPGQVVEISCRVRYTTTIELPPEERILDWVAGDTASWQVTGSANVTYVKPVIEDAETNVTLVTESGRIYLFLARETDETPPDIHVGVSRAPVEADATPPPPPPHKPMYVSRDEVAEFERAAEQASKRAAEAWSAADARIRKAVDEFRSDYPTLMRFEYRLEKKAQDLPFAISGMWHDGRFTYARSHAEETPALYEAIDGKPSLVNYDLLPDGLYIVRRVLHDGWFQLGKRRANWTRLVVRQPAVGPPPLEPSPPEAQAELAEAE